MPENFASFGAAPGAPSHIRKPGDLDSAFAAALSLYYMRSVVRAEQALLASLHFVLNIGKAKQF